MKLELSHAFYGNYNGNNPSMSSADWIEHHTKMKKYTDAFTRNEMFAAVNDRQCIISAEIDEAEQPHLTGPC